MFICNFEFLKNGYQYMHNWIFKTENGMEQCHTNIFMHFLMIKFQHMQLSNLGFTLLHPTNVDQLTQGQNINIFKFVKKIISYSKFGTPWSYKFLIFTFINFEIWDLIFT
jgi:hypothetical protein